MIRINEGRRWIKRYGVGSIALLVPGIMTVAIVIEAFLLTVKTRSTAEMEEQALMPDNKQTLRKCEG